MLEEKIVLVVVMICVALFIASLIKFERLNFKKLIFSIFMPIFLLFFLIHFSRFIWKNDFEKFSAKEKFPRILKLIALEIQWLPTIHTALIFIIEYMIKEKADSQLIKLNFKIPPNSSPMHTLRRELNPLLEI